MGPVTIQCMVCTWQIPMAHGPNWYRCGCHWGVAMGGWGLYHNGLWVSLHKSNGQWGPRAMGWCPTGGAAMGVGGCSLPFVVCHCTVAMANGGHVVSVCVPLGVLLWGLGAATPNLGKAVAHQTPCGLQIGDCCHGCQRSRDGGQKPQRARPNGHPTKGILMCVYGG